MIGQPVQGPVTADGVPPQASPYIDRLNKFLEQFPQGTEGMTTDTIMRPLPGGGYVQEQVKRPKSGKTILGKSDDLDGSGGDKPRTFQEKQEVYNDAGDPIGYMNYDTKTGKKDFVQYDKSLMPEGATFGPKIKPVIPAGAVEKQAAQKGMLDLVETIRGSYKPELTGPIQGRIREKRQKYDVGATPEAATFERSLADLRSAVINERTGAQVGERQEWDRLMQLIPDDKKADPDFVRKLSDFEARYKQIIANRASKFKSSGYRNPVSGGSSVEDDPLGVRGGL